MDRGATDRAGARHYCDAKTTDPAPGSIGKPHSTYLRPRAEVMPSVWTRTPTAREQVLSSPDLCGGMPEFGAGLLRCETVHPLTPLAPVPWSRARFGRRACAGPIVRATIVEAPVVVALWLDESRFCPLALASSRIASLVSVAPPRLSSGCPRPRASLRSARSSIPTGRSPRSRSTPLGCD